MDLQLISGEFFHDESVPKDKRWLQRYFRTPSQRRFLAYYLQFSALRCRSPYHFYRNFTDHTGVYCTKRAIQKWTKKLLLLESLVRAATEGLELAALEVIKSGRYRFSQNGKATSNPCHGAAL
jgi:hypothetical protein